MNSRQLRTEGKAEEVYLMPQQGAYNIYSGVHEVQDSLSLHFQAFSQPPLMQADPWRLHN